MQNVVVLETINTNISSHCLPITKDSSMFLCARRDHEDVLSGKGTTDGVVMVVFGCSSDRARGGK